MKFLLPKGGKSYKSCINVGYWMNGNWTRCRHLTWLYTARIWRGLRMRLNWVKSCELETFKLHENDLFDFDQSKTSRNYFKFSQIARICARVTEISLRFEDKFNHKSKLEDKIKIFMILWLSSLNFWSIFFSPFTNPHEFFTISMLFDSCDRILSFIPRIPLQGLADDELFSVVPSVVLSHEKFSFITWLKWKKIQCFQTFVGIFNIFQALPVNKTWKFPMETLLNADWVMESSQKLFSFSDVFCALLWCA